MLRSSLVVAAAVLCLSGCKSREEKLKAAEEEANLLASTKARLVKGVGEALKTEGKDAAKSVSEGTGDVVKAVGSGFDKSLSQVKVAVFPALAERGIGVTRASKRNAGQQKSVTVYVLFDKPYSGKLEMRAYDAEKLEVGRSVVTLDEKEPTAKYVDFTFDERTPLFQLENFELR
jgi:hypothetical protein